MGKYDSYIIQKILLGSIIIFDRGVFIEFIMLP